MNKKCKWVSIPPSGYKTGCGFIVSDKIKHFLEEECFKHCPYCSYPIQDGVKEVK